MITVRFFARLREELGESELQLAIENSPSVGEVKQQLMQRSALWQQALADSNIITALNQQVCEAGSTVVNGDELAFFPPVTGG